MKIRSLVVTAVLAIAVLCFGGAVNAQTTSVSAQIAQLQAQIASLLAQIQTLQTQQNSAEAWCHTFTINLRVNDNGSEVQALQTALEKEGLLIVGSQSAADSPFYNFGDGTASAVVAFQEKYASTILTPSGLAHGTGYVGPATRAKLNALYGCQPTQTLTPVPTITQPSTTTQPSISILSPNGGETYKNDGSPITVNWTTRNVPSDFKFDVIKLSGYPNGGEYNLATNVLNDGQEVIIPSNVPAGNYTLEIKAYLNNVLVMDSSDSYFSIVAPTIAALPTASQPSITKIDPNTVRIGNSVNIVGTGFTTDSDNSICYAGVIGNCYKARATSTTSLSFNIPYSEFPGTVGIYITNMNGTSNVYRSLTLVNAPVSISSISPTSALPGATVTINGSGFAGFTSGVNRIYLGTNELSFTNASATSLQFIVPSITSGIYELYVKNSNGESNKINFTINSVSAQPSITVVSPNGGETFGASTVMQVSWNSQGSVAQTSSVGIYLLGSDGTTVSGFGGSAYTNSPGKTTIVIPENITPARDYKVKVVAGSYSDVSDGYITILSSTEAGYNACRLDQASGSNITRGVILDQSQCLALCDVYGPLNFSVRPKCVFKGQTIKSYTTY